MKSRCFPEIWHKKYLGNQKSNSAYLKMFPKCDIKLMLHIFVKLRDKFRTKVVGFLQIF